MSMTLGSIGEDGVAAEHAHAADRFAREIVRILTRFCGALAAADGQAVGQQPSTAYRPDRPSECQTVEPQNYFSHHPHCRLHIAVPYAILLVQLYL